MSHINTLPTEPFNLLLTEYDRIIFNEPLYEFDAAHRAWALLHAKARAALIEYVENRQDIIADLIHEADMTFQESPQGQELIALRGEVAHLRAESKRVWELVAMGEEVTPERVRGV